ncbi:hypothetical protein L209DRAFT_781391 [Thermothelomyces heterothallicus CBS 203.75]
MTNGRGRKNSVANSLVAGVAGCGANILYRGLFREIGVEILSESELNRGAALTRWVRATKCTSDQQNPSTLFSPPFNSVFRCSCIDPTMLSVLISQRCIANCADIEWHIYFVQITKFANETLSVTFGRRTQMTGANRSAL